METYQGHTKIGGFAWKHENKTHFADLYQLDDFDSQYYKPVGLNSGEMLFRYTTDAAKIGGYLFLVKINVDNNRIYFLQDHNNDTALFETRGIKLQHLTIWDKL